MKIQQPKRKVKAKAANGANGPNGWWVTIPRTTNSLCMSMYQVVFMGQIKTKTKTYV